MPAWDITPSGVSSVTSLVETAIQGARWGVVDVLRPDMVSITEEIRAEAAKNAGGGSRKR